MRYQVLDTPPEDQFDRITRLAGRLCDVPYALISFIDQSRQWCKSCYGLTVQEIKRDVALCARPVQEGELFVVEDAQDDPRFADNPLVRHQPGIRFYAGAPIMTTDGYAVGTLCLMDTQPRTLTSEDRHSLRDLAALVTDELERRLEPPLPSLDPADSGESAPARWRRLISGHPEAILILDKDGIIRYSNPAGPPIFGVSSTDDLQKRSLFDFVRSDQLRDLQSQLDLLTAGETVPKREFIIRRLDGSERHLEVHSSPTTHEGEAAAQSVVRDVTERKRTEEELRASEGRYRKLLEKANDAIFIADTKTGMLLEANQKAQELVGRSPEAIRHMHQADLYPPEEREQYRKLFEAGVFEDSALGEDRYVIDREGRRIPVEISASVIEINDRLLVQSIFRDISERRQHEEELRRVRRAVDEAGDGIAVLDLSGDVVYQNKALNQLLGYPAEMINAVGGPSALFTDADTGRRMTSRMLQGKSWSGETTMRDRGGQKLPVSVRSDVITDQNEEVVGFIVVFTDITERKEYEQKLLAAKENAEEISRLKSAFLTNMNHEIRTPLTSILGYAELLGEEVPPRLQSYVRSIQSSGQRLLDTLSSVLNLAQLESHTFTLNPKPVDLKKQVREAVSLLRPRAKQQKIQLSCQVPDLPVAATLDRVALNQVLRNLLMTAIKFTSEGSITVRLEPDEERAIVAVENTGIGLSPAFQAHLFDASQPKPTDLPPEYEGTGLSLSITKQLVELMGGDITIKPAEGQGNIFQVHLPRETMPSQQAA